MSERQAGTYRRATATPEEQRMMVLLNNANIPYEWQSPEIFRDDEWRHDDFLIGHIGGCSCTNCPSDHESVNTCEEQKCHCCTGPKSYIPDFCVMPERTILIEVDGKIHSKHEEYDLRRDSYLQKKGYRVMRFTNRDVMRDAEHVIRAIQIERVRVVDRDI